MAEQRSTGRQILARLGQLARGVGRRLQSLGQWLVRQAWRVGRWFWRTGEVAMLSREIQDLRQQRREHFAHIGEQVYLLYQKHLVRNPDVVALCEEVRDLDALIEEKEAQREAKQKEPLLPEQEEPVTVAEVPLEAEPPSSGAG